MRIQGFSDYEYNPKTEKIISYRDKTKGKNGKELTFKKSISLIADDDKKRYTFLLQKIKYAVSKNIDPRRVQGIIRENKLITLSQSANISSLKKKEANNCIEKEDYFQDIQDRIDFLNIQKEIHTKGNIGPYLEIEKNCRPQAINYLVNSYRIPEDIAGDIYDEVALDCLELVLKKKLIISSTYLFFIKGRLCNKVYKAKNRLCNIDLKNLRIIEENE